jgi:hypothetical protein
MIKARMQKVCILFYPIYPNLSMNVLKPVLLLCIALCFCTRLGAQDLQPTNEEVIGKIKTALAPLFQENQDYTFSDLKTESGGAGFKVSGTATFFQMTSVQLVATFASADVMARFELTFPAGSKLSADVQQKLAKQNFVNWIPGDIQKILSLLKIQSAPLGFSLSPCKIGSR